MLAKFSVISLGSLICLAAVAGDRTKIVDGARVANGPIYIVSNSAVESIDYPNLEYLNGPLYIVGNDHLKTVSFPKLFFVNGPIYITYNAVLTYLDDSALSTVNGPVYYYANGYAKSVRHVASPKIHYTNAPGPRFPRK